MIKELFITFLKH
ncbi:hypothetical protein [Plasmodium yoelii yoelii]|uniref:Uncharacterized protein n=1 Tax=Plasmodium yoelii yoelii TaxID=73239 RepID=Q7RH69_PLAYO|nr:hypothetical protein [Plasmodium yoelii yoelii]